MTETICVAFAVLAVSAALRPRPAARTPIARVRRPIWSRPAAGKWVRRRPTRVGAAAVAAWCEALARAVRGGSSLPTAIRSTEPPAACGDTIRSIVLGLDRGSRLNDALGVATGSSHLDLAVTVLRACAINGGSPAEPLDRAAATLRGRAADAADRRTQSAQARLSAVVMTVLPLAMLALLLVTSGTTRTAAMSPAGLVAISVGAALNVVGWTWMRRIVARVA